MKVSQMCDCGCSHWCSMYPIWEMCRWSLRALADGVYPTMRHDGGPWRPSDGERELLAGKAGIGVRFRCSAYVFSAVAVDHRSGVVHALGCACIVMQFIAFISEGNVASRRWDLDGHRRIVMHWSGA
eukprot:8362842-Pyramimonas_sp.AAC.1